ncbi:ABC transporter permease [Ornithobacterium rhinotracheale]|uniref:ABC transporter permease n=1 Tax=Ornithobacterium rhinotracheale TaxID=28251 RepID=UPI003FA46807
MKFSQYFAYKIAWGKTSQESLSRNIVRIGQFAVAIGIIVALITLSTGIGAKKEIKQKLADFGGHLTITPYNSNLSMDSDTLHLNPDYYPKFPSKNIEHIQSYAVKSGIIRSKESFDGVLFKGVDAKYDTVRFQKFLKKGHFPKFNPNKISDEVVISQEIANNFYLKVGSTFVMVFINEKNPEAKPIYRKFKVAGIYSTDIEQFDKLYVIGDLKQVQRINQWAPDVVGGYELFVPDVDQDLTPVKEEVNNLINYNLIALTATDHFSEIEEWIKIFDTNIFIILFIMLFVVVINMVMVLLILILERTHSIGVLKTLGANNSQIRQIFIAYAVFIMLPGLIAGNSIALLLLWIQSEFGIVQLPPENYYISQAPVFLSWQMILLVNLGSILISILALWLPSLLIKRITPTRALKVK